MTSGKTTFLELSNYPERPAERDRWILAHRDARPGGDPLQPQAFHLEQERAESGNAVSVATVFLTSRECPWRCLMCDLWKHTLAETVPLGAIPTQIDHALAKLGVRGGDAGLPDQNRHASQIKLYNSGSFFDPRSIPPKEYPAIAERVYGFERVIVECHPARVGKSAVRFRDLLREYASKLRRGAPKPPRLEVAMGLETAHPQVLDKLNKRMTLAHFARACEFLRQHEIAVRAFILVKPPFLNDAEALEWAVRSLDFAFASGVEVAVLIPTRGGNGALEALARSGQFSPPRLAMLEAALDYGLHLRRGRVFADLWDLEKFSRCAACFPSRADRLRQMNLQQTPLPAVPCAACGGT